MCGVGGKADRRPIDPPPIVQLRVIDPAFSGGAGVVPPYGPAYGAVSSNNNNAGAQAAANSNNAGKAKFNPLIWGC
jgi:hypothetical protein